MRINIKKASATNFLQYPHVDISFDNQGLVFLSGALKHNRSRSNSAGKTAALSLVPWVLWGKILKDMRDVTGVIRYGEQECVGELLGAIDGVDFKIERRRSKSGSSLYASFAGSSRAQDVQSEINAVFGTFDLAQNTVFLAQRKALEFLSATETERKKILEELLKIKIWREAQDRVKEDIEWAKEKEAKLLRELQSAKHSKEKLEIEIKHASEVATSDLRSTIRLCQEEIEEKELQLPLLKSQYDLLHRHYNENELSNYRLLFSAHAKSEADMRSLFRELESLTKEHSAKLQEYKKIKSGGVCPTCCQQIPPHSEEAIKAAEVRLSEYARAISDKSVEVKRQEKIVEGAKSKALASSDKERAKKQEVFSAREKLQLAEERIRAAQSKMSDAEKKLKNFREVTNEKNKEKLFEYDAVIDAKAKALTELEQGKKAMEFWKEGFSFKGIPSMLIADSLPLLVHHANYVLNVLSDSEMSMDILTSDVKRDGKSLMDKLTFLVSKGGREVYMEDCSAGEQRRIVISIFLALARMQSLLTGVHWNIRLVDELFDELDAHGIERVMRVLKEMANDHTILVTSHRSSLRDLDGFDQRWTVLRGDHGSSLITSSTEA
jgi:DNA repair exonuclease SbcCD ATPase subunit